MNRPKHIFWPNPVGPYPICNPRGEANLSELDFQPTGHPVKSPWGHQILFRLDAVVP